ncbi:Hypothetical predicted protein [Cloeon dipterum]|uniref:Protein BCCIP homolog n=1 Tax=Cloeon dipterum TaxID=197152 RepID=A0A8S1E4F7_9INSE|nr:Hypothetical predicted protein [Cloeon dipterum]
MDRIGNLETIKFDVMGRCAEDSDFHGIRTLLSSQLLPHTDVDVSNLTDLIIEQNYVGSVIVEDCDTMPGADDDDDDDDTLEEITLLGVTTAVSLAERERFPCVKQLKELLLTLAEKHGRNDALIANLLAEKPCKLGLLINERFVNIPQTIAPPIFFNLKKELQSAVNKKMPFAFTYFVLIAKINKVEIENEVLDEWVNEEEEFLKGKTEYEFEFPLQAENESSIEEEMKQCGQVPYRRVMIFPAHVFEHLIDTLRAGQ